MRLGLEKETRTTLLIYQLELSLAIGNSCNIHGSDVSSQTVSKTCPPCLLLVSFLRTPSNDATPAFSKQRWPEAHLHDEDIDTSDDDKSVSCTCSDVLAINGTCMLLRCQCVASRSLSCLW
jgi:hypothetical protein